MDLKSPVIAADAVENLAFSAFSKHEQEIMDLIMNDEPIIELDDDFSDEDLARICEELRKRGYEGQLILMDEEEFAKI